MALYNSCAESNKYMDVAYRIAKRACLITPARFLFNAGKTPEAWNLKMLGDEHFKVVHYEPHSSKVFTNTNIVGGVAITYRDSGTKCGAIKQFITTSELNSIANKVKGIDPDKSLSDIAYHGLALLQHRCTTLDKVINP